MAVNLTAVVNQYIHWQSKQIPSTVLSEDEYVIFMPIR